MVIYSAFSYKNSGPKPHINNKYITTEWNFNRSFLFFFFFCNTYFKIRLNVILLLLFERDTFSILSFTMSKWIITHWCIRFCRQTQCKYYYEWIWKEAINKYVTDFMKNLYLFRYNRLVISRQTVRSGIRVQLLVLASSRSYSIDNISLQNVRFSNNSQYSLRQYRTWMLLEANGIMWPCVWIKKKKVVR